MKKKLLSLVMAVAMILSLAAPAFASGYYEWSTDTSKQNKNEQTLKFPAKMFVPTVKLTLPNLSGTDPVVLNPYRIEYTAGTASAPTMLNSAGTVDNSVASANYNQQVICPVYAIKNETNAKLNVKAKIDTLVTGGLKLVGNNESHVALSETDTKAMINFVVKKESVSSATYTSTYAVNVGSALPLLNAYDTANNTVIKLQASNAVQKVAVMKNASLESTTASDKVNFLLFQFDGELSRDPSTPWVAGDKFTSTVVFTFTPVAIGDAVGEYTKTDVPMNIADNATAISIPLPTMGESGTSLTLAENGLTSFGKNPDVASWTPSLAPAATRSWSIVDAGALNVSLSGSGDSTALSIDATAQKSLPVDGQPHNYTCVIGFNDVNGVPRTAEITLKLTRQNTSA